VLAQLPRLNLTWLDGSGSTAEMRITIGSSLPVATIEAAAIGLIAAVSAITDAVFVSQEIVYNFVPPSGSEVPPGASILDTGVFIFENDSVPSVGLVEVHSIKADTLVTSGPGAGVLIDMADSRVSTFVGALDDAGACNPFAHLLGDLVTAYKQSRA
jgi:hypothetical protein